MLQNGLYEQIINRKLEKELARSDKLCQTAPIDTAEAAKVRGYMRNLVCAAMGTGKTIVSALDYKRFRREHTGQPCRLLFVAHREEILKQSLYTFRAVLKDQNFGEMFVGSYRPERLDALFISIQTFNAQDFTNKTTKDFYDYIVVDEYGIIGQVKRRPILKAS